ncbi:MAG: VCBS repeat-containing protein [Myxococcales bacterium]|nr:VCBS repeat-containing protein [Myxococcales bacterium]
MKNTERMSMLLSVMSSLAILGGCQGDAPEELEPRVGPRPTVDELGARSYATEASQRRRLCPDGVGCTTADVNRDGKDDLVRYDSFGVFGSPGTVEVAYSNGWDFGPMQVVADGVCVDESACTVADVDGDGVPDLVRFIRDGGPNLVEAYLGIEPALGDSIRFETPVPWGVGMCSVGQLCAAADVDGDDHADLIAFEGGQDGRVMVARSQGLGALPPAEWAVGLCVGEAQCRLGDVDGDGRADVVELDPTTGLARVALAQELGGFAAAQIWADGISLAPDATFQLGDLDGDLDVDLMVMGPAVAAEPEADPMSCESSCGSAAPGGCWCDEVCTEYGDCCVDYEPACLSGDGGGTGGAGAPDSCEGACGGVPAGGTCFCDEACVDYGDCCVDYDSYCPAGGSTGGGGSGGAPDSCEGVCGGSSTDGTCWCDEACVDYGDCCLDYDAACAPAQPTATIGRILVWGAAGDHFEPTFELDAEGCESGQRCWAADVTGDGRADLVSVDDLGTVTLWPSEDVLDRLERDAMRLTLLRADWERRRAEQARRVVADVVDDAVPLPAYVQALPRYSGGSSVPPPATPTPTDPATPFEPLPDLEPWSEVAPGSIDATWLADQDALRVAAVEAGIAEVLGDLPPESGLQWTADQLRWQKALGKVVAARTALYAPPLGVSAPSRGGACHNAVLHDRIDDDGVPRHEGSYLMRYYDALRHQDLDERLWASLPALTGVVEGMRCLSQRELAGLEEAFVRAVLATMEDLVDLGQEPLAQIVWDQALPVELLLFDGVKPFTMPKGWQMLQVRIESGALVVPDLPDPGSDFDQYRAEDLATCSTVRCGLYKGPARATVSGQNLTLDTLGVWLPDLTARERLRKSGLDPQVLLDAIVNLEVLGEGDCPLIELTHYNLSCKSERTCQVSAAMAEAGASMTTEPLPGMFGSPYTHFGTDRADLALNNECSVPPPGGAVPSPCVGPNLRGLRGKHFPLDPELDSILSCTMQTFDGETPSEIAVELDFGVDSACLVSGPDDLNEEERLKIEDEVTDMSAAVAQELSGGGIAEGLGYPSRTEMAQVIADKTGATYEEVLAAMLRVGYQGFQHVMVSSQATNAVVDVVTYPASGPFTDYGVMVYAGSVQADLDAMLLPTDPTAAEPMIEGYLFGQLLRAAVHMVLDTLAARNQTSVLEPEVEEDIAGVVVGVGRSCDPGALGSCSSSCGYEDARLQRMSQCLAGGSPAPFDRCTTAEDYCATRRNGELEYDAGLGCEAPVLPPLPPLCAAVNCDGGGDLAGACCGHTGAEGEPLPYGPQSPDPGPHPGSPDGPLPPVPGGPGGVPIPPFPPVPPGY